MFCDFFKISIPDKIIRKHFVRDTDFEKITKHPPTAPKKCFNDFWRTILCLSDWQRYKEHVWYQKHTLKMRKKCSRDIQTMFMKNHTSFFLKLWYGMRWNQRPSKKGYMKFYERGLTISRALSTHLEGMFWVSNMFLVKLPIL